MNWQKGRHSVMFGGAAFLGRVWNDAQQLVPRIDLRFDQTNDPAAGIFTTANFAGASAGQLADARDLGAPEGRYFAPANTADCIQLKAGDCAPRTVILLAPWFTRFDIGVTKRIRMDGNRSLELRADVLNVFDNVNFTVADANRTPGPGGTIFQTDSAYRDLDNTYDPGGRLGQLAIRFNR